MARDVLALFNLRLEDTPFAQVPLGEALIAELEVEPDELLSVFERPRKRGVEVFGRQYGKRIRFFVLKRDPHNGIVLHEQYIKGK